MTRYILEFTALIFFGLLVSAVFAALSEILLYTDFLTAFMWLSLVEIVVLVGILVRDCLGELRNRGL